MSNPINARVQAPWSVHLNAIRGIAAVLVVLEHLRLLFFVKYPEVHHKNHLLPLLYSVCSMGHNAVMVFFVLSGYFISASIYRMHDRGTWSWALYSVHRLTRLYVVLLPALVFGALWDILGLHLHGAGAVYLGSGALNTIIRVPVHETLTVKNFLGNLFFLQGIVTGTFGSNVPLWSLSYEFWYYVLFPAALIVVLPRQTVAVRVLCAAAVLACGAFVGHAILLYFAIWLMGAALAFAERAGVQWRPGIVVQAILGIALIAAVAAIRIPHFGDSIVQGLAVGLVFSLIVLVIISNKSTPAKNPSRLYTAYAKSADFLAGRSYTLYLVHAPFMVFLCSFLFPTGNLWQPTALHCVMSLLVVAVVLCYASGIWFLAESRTDTLRKRIESFFKLTPARGVKKPFEFKAPDQNGKQSPAEPVEAGASHSPLTENRIG